MPPSQYLNGHIERVAMYGTQLTDAFLQQETGGTPPPPPPPPPPVSAVRMFGFGKNSIGGRGGTIYHVTHLGDTGANSLREHLQRTNPRIIVFDVSGTITLGSNIDVNNPFVTVAGQTAPNPGIKVISDFGMINMRAHDTIWQQLQFEATTANNRDAFNMFTNGTVCYNNLLDHCTIRNGDDESLDIGTTSSTLPFVHDITVQYCYVSRSSAFGSAANSLAQRVTWYRTIIAFSAARTGPRMVTCGDAEATTGALGTLCSTEFINHMMYNGGAHCQVGQTSTTHAAPADITSKYNRLVTGPQSTSNAMFQFLGTSSNAWATGSRFYNIGSTVVGTQAIFADGGAGQPHTVGTPPLDSGITDLITDGPTLEAHLLSYCGSRPTNRDPVIQTDFNEIASRTGTQGRGPVTTYASNPRVFVPVANPNGDDNGDGITNIEDQLWAMSDALVGW